MHLSYALLLDDPQDCIIRCIGASTTDNFPEETIQNTLVSTDWVAMMRPSYWSSAGHFDPAVPECLFYRLRSDLCLVQQINIQPFRGQPTHPPSFFLLLLLNTSITCLLHPAFFQYGDPIYSAKYVRFQMGYPKTPLPSQLLVSHDNEGQLAADDNYIWTYTSPQFPMLQVSVFHAVTCLP